MLIPGLPFDESLVKSDNSVEDGEIVKLLKTSANPKVKVLKFLMKLIIHQAARKKKKAAEKAITEVGLVSPVVNSHSYHNYVGHRNSAEPRGKLTLR